ncbi:MULTISPECIES: hypothetical protein [Streptomyces]|uniref:hypothetical protein n=1 Tax=Streptomyces TaxID=1883 RepID=UPI0006B5245F|nr:hypothetical protein [Streptomyces sp. NRRL S-4]
MTVAAVDVAAGSDGHRDWAPPVLCHFTGLGGDLALAWDVHAPADLEPAPPTESEAVLRLAARLGSTVLHPAEGVRPSACWAATPEGTGTRARVLDGETGGDNTGGDNTGGHTSGHTSGHTGGEARPVLRADAAEEPVRRLPLSGAERIPEVRQDG